MNDFSGKIAVVTGGGTGMGRALARSLSRQGCHVAMCDLNADHMREARELCVADAPDGVRVTTHVADVSDESQVLAFRDHVVEKHDTDHVHLVFNNAGIAGGGSFVLEPRDRWETTFGVCWYGVYYGCRAFLPLLIAAPEGHLVNTSSVNGFWASLGPFTSHTAYSAAKFAVKGFTEALVTDLELNAPHVKVSLVMPGHIGTSIVSNTAAAHGRSPEELTSEDLDGVREQMKRMGIEAGGASDDQIREGMRRQAEQFRDEAPMTADAAAEVILDGVREERWRILVGEDAHALDELVRSDPESAYDANFLERWRAASAERQKR